VPFSNDPASPLKDEPAQVDAFSPGPSSDASVPAQPILIDRIFCTSPPTGPLRQSEILASVIQRRRTLRSLLPNIAPEISEIRHPLAIIISQDCDLERDYEFRSSRIADEVDPSSDKILPSVLLCEVITADELLTLVPKGKDIWKRIIQNKDERYHVLSQVSPTSDAAGQGLPAMGIDFKRHFSIFTDELYTQLRMGVGRRCCLNSPYLEHLSSRFANYLSRVGLPLDHTV
jgi:hypothetical protein